MSRRPGRQDDKEEEEDDIVFQESPQPADEELTWPNLQELAVKLNQDSMECLRKSENEKAYEQLMRAQDILAQAERYCPTEAAAELSTARAAISSSFAICFKRNGDYPSAVRYLENALELYQQAEADLRTLLAARLNLSGCFSEAEMPEEALQHAMAAVALGGQLIAQGGLSGSDAEAKGGQQQGIRPDDYAMLAVAYHKTAEAHEHMKQWGQATLAYTQAYEVVRRSLGPYHQLTKSFEKSARCPRRPAPPEVPLSWRASAAAAKASNSPRMPVIPRVGRSQGSKPAVVTPLRGTPPQPLGYRLGSAGFPSWPPKKVTSEEQYWYQLALDDRKQKKAAVINQIRHQGENNLGRTL